MEVTMSRVRKILFGTSITALLLIAAIYYRNIQNDVDAGNDKGEQRNTTINQSNENNASKQSVDDTVEQTSSIIENDNKKNIVSNLSQDEISQRDITKINELMSSYYDFTNEFNSNILISNNPEDIDQRKILIRRKKEVIQSYEGIKNYIKQSLTEDTYIVYTTYDIKFKNINTLVPGMSVLTVVKDAEELLINVSPHNKELNDYIKQVAETDDMKEIIEEVNRELADAIKKDASLEEFIDYLKDIT